jgi:anti-sigma factor RsiW
MDNRTEGENTMDCRDIQADFIRYIDDDLSEEEKLRVELHVAECYGCRERLDELGRLLEVCGAVMEHPCPVDRFDELRQRLASVDPPYTPVPRRPELRRRELIRKVAVAAVIIAALAASPLLVKGARLLFSPVQGTATLGNGTGIAVPFRVPFLEEKLKLQEEVAEWAITGSGDRDESSSRSSRE